MLSTVAHEPSVKRNKKPRRRQRGTGSVREKYPGKWEMRYKGHDEMVGASTKTEAQRELEKWVERLRNGGLPKNGTMTFGELADRYLAARRGKVAATTLAWYKRNLAHHVRPALGDMQLPEITAAHIDSLLDAARDCSRTKRRGESLGPASGRNLLVSVRALLAWGVSRKFVAENVALLVEAPSVADIVERPILVADDVNTFIRATRGTELEAIVTTAIFTGLRRSELCALQWGDLDLDEGRITVQRAAANVGGKVIVKATKTKKSRRTDHLSPFTIALLRRHRDDQKERYVAFGLAARLHGEARKKAFVFDRQDGRAWDPNELSRMFSRLVRSKNLPRLRFHDLRHGFAPLSVASGSSMKELSESMGHSGIAITSNLYVHLYAAQKRESKAAFDAYVTPRLDPTLESEASA